MEELFLGHSMGNPRVTRAVPTPTPALNLYPLPRVWVPTSMTHGYPSYIVTLPHHPGHPFIIPFITSPATTAAAAAAPANKDDAGNNSCSCSCPCQRARRWQQQLQPQLPTPTRMMWQPRLQLPTRLRTTLPATAPLPLSPYLYHTI